MTEQLFMRLFVVVTGSLAFLLIIGGSLYLMSTGALAQNDSTQIDFFFFKASGVLAGLVFLALIAFFMVQIGLRPTANPLRDMASMRDNPAEGAADEN